MPESKLAVHNLHIHAGMKTAIDAARSGAYETLNEAVKIAIYDGMVEAQEVPAVRFGLDATFYALEQAQSDPTTASKMPKEIHERSLYARQCADQITYKAAGLGTFVTFYATDPSLAWMLKRYPSFIKRLRDGERISSLLRAPFMDATLGIGGGHKKLAEEGIVNGRQALLLSSQGLMAVSKLRDENRSAFRRRTGDPYTLTRHLEIVGTNQLTYASYAQSLIRQLSAKDSGCPARKITPIDYLSSVLTESWQRFVTYLAPEDATSNLGNDGQTVAPNARLPRAAYKQQRGRKRGG